jgi:hypothetical protein
VVRGLVPIFIFFGHNAERSDRSFGWTKQSDERWIISLPCVILQPLSRRSANHQHARQFSIQYRFPLRTAIRLMDRAKTVSLLSMQRNETVRPPSAKSASASHSNQCEPSTTAGLLV